MKMQRLGYYRHKEPERRQMYLDKCAEHLTFFDYETVEKRAKRLESVNRQLEAENKDLQDMRREIKELWAEMDKKNRQT